ncbi:MAG TPA: Phenylacetic acid catabolic protein [Gaiellaceae bacterium]
MPELSPELSQATANVVVALADNKYFLAHRLATWGVGAPTLESAVACTAIAQEEAGHARVLYSLLEEFPREMAPPPLEREHDRERKYTLSYLLEPTRSFVRGVAALTLADRACTVLLEAAATSSCESLRKRAVRILGDERFHQRFADGRVRELARTPALERELAALLPETLCWFGPPGEPGLELLVAAGIVTQRNEELRQAFLSKLAAVAERAGVELPIARNGDETWTYPELPWSQWNSLERRLTATPATATS